MKPIWIIYGRPNCVWCDRAKNFLTERGEEWQYLNIEQPNIMADFKMYFPTAKTVPQLISPEGIQVGGFNDLVELFH